ncbi:hypothetical protein SLOPH_849, partial [Spraguea lophii 42_110]
MHIFVIDNGSHTIRYGYNTDKDYKSYDNILYRYKDKTSFQPFTSSTPKTMFDIDIVTNIEIAEQTFDLILEEYYRDNNKHINKDNTNINKNKSIINKSIKKNSKYINDYNNYTPIENIILTENLYTPTMYKKEMIELWMEAYNVNNIQLGIDSIYSFIGYNNINNYNAGNKNIIPNNTITNTTINNINTNITNNKNITLIIKIGNCSTSVILYDNNIIIESFKIPLGNRELENILHELLTIKYGYSKHKYTGNIQCTINYNSSIENMKDDIINNKENDKDENDRECDKDEDNKDVNKIIKNNKKGKVGRKRKIVEDNNNDIITHNKKSIINSDDATTEEEILYKSKNKEDNENSSNNSDDEVYVSDNESEYEENDNEEDNEESDNNDIEESDNNDNIEKNNNDNIEEHDNNTDTNIPNTENKSIAYFSSLYRLKVRIEKILHLFKDNINRTEDKYNFISNKKEYILNLKNKYITLKHHYTSILRTERNLRDKKSRERNTLFKMGTGSEMNERDREVIERIEDVENKDIIEKEMESIKNRLMEIINKELYPDDGDKSDGGNDVESKCDSNSGKDNDNIGGSKSVESNNKNTTNNNTITTNNNTSNIITNIDNKFYKEILDIISNTNISILEHNLIQLDMCYLGEILFYPSLISCKQPGIVEILEYISKRYNVNKVYIDGMVIEGFKERIEYEINMNNSQSDSYNRGDRSEERFS